MSDPSACERSGRGPTHALRVLGGLALATIDARTIELPTRKSATLLAYLAVPAGVAHARDKLGDLLWPTSGQEQARGSLRHALAALRKALGADAIEGARDRVCLRPERIKVDLDVVAAIAEGRAAPDLALPASLSTPTFLEGLMPEGEAFGEWLTFERTRTRALLQRALQRTIDALAAAHRHGDAIAAAERLVALDPLREQSHRVLMQAFSTAGERSMALDQFRKLQDILKEELGVAPSAQSVALARSILQDRTETAAAMASAAEPASSFAPSRGSIEAPPRRLTIAVLPLQCLSADEHLIGFAEGFSSDLVAGLSRISELAVIAWQSSAQMSGSPADAVRSAAELGADYALAGNVRSSEGRIRIGAQLIAAASRAWAWADRYDLEAADALSAQDRIITGITGAVDAGVRRIERETARAKPLANLDAWSLYHRGMWHLYRFTRDDVVKAEDLFRAALSKDPAASAPHAGLAYTCIVRTGWHLTSDFHVTVAEGLRHAREAVARDEHDAQAHTMLGRLLVMSTEIGRGIEHLERAIELNPSLAHAHYALGRALYAAGRPDDALVRLDTALRLSPKDPLASMFLTAAALCHLMRDDLDAAEAAARRARNLLSRETWSRLTLAATMQIKGNLAEARRAITEAREIEPDLSIARFTPLVHHIPKSERERILDALAAAGLPEA